MRTGHSLTAWREGGLLAGGSPCHGGSPCRGVLLAWGSPCWVGGLPAGWGVSLPGGLPIGGSPYQGGSLVGGSPCQGGSPCWRPPVNRMTDTCKNITLATTLLRPVIINLYIFSCASAKAERSLSSLYGVFLCVELGDPPPPARISWVWTKMLHHFCMTPNLPWPKRPFPLAKPSWVHTVILHLY